MRGRNSITRCISLAGLVAALGVLLALPAFSAADFVGGAVSQVGSGAPQPPAAPVGGGGDQPRAGTPGDATQPYHPPQHGKNPHGQGTVGVIDIRPDTSWPPVALSGDPAGGDPMGTGEDIVVGRARGEQNADGSYHGNVTAVALFGNELIGIESNTGETNQSPSNQLQTDLLDAICAGSGGQLCLTVLAMSSSTTDSGSTNHFQVASAHLGDAAGANQINAGAASSNGNISDDGTCQTSSGDSDVANADVGGPSGAGQLSADALRSSSTSKGCNNGGAPTQTNTSSNQLADINDNDIGCADSPPAAPDQYFPPGSVPLAPLLAIICAANESNDAQATAPQGAREALTVFVASAVPLAKLTTAASESIASASGPIPCTGPDCPPPDCLTNPTAPECDVPIPCSTKPCNPRPCVIRGDCPPDPDPDPVCTRAADCPNPNGDSLPFTGTNVLLIAMAGLGLLGVGLAVRATLAVRRL